jgi:hypothetical protein
MASQVFQTLDLIRHIYSFGDPDHRQQMIEICKELRHENVSRYGKELLSSIPKYYYEHSTKDAHSEFMLESLKQFFRCGRCQCCSRHAHRKPTMIRDPPYGYLCLEREERHVPEDKHLEPCDCSCRKIMRCLIHEFAREL